MFSNVGVDGCTSVSWLQKKGSGGRKYYAGNSARNFGYYLIILHTGFHF